MGAEDAGEEAGWHLIILLLHARNSGTAEVTFPVVQGPQVGVTDAMDTWSQPPLAVPILWFKLEPRAAEAAINPPGVPIPCLRDTGPEPGASRIRISHLHVWEV